MIIKKCSLALQEDMRTNKKESEPNLLLNIDCK
jgi:hypothetical protein